MIVLTLMKVEDVTRIVVRPLRYFHPKMSGDLPKALYIHSDQAGRHAWLPHKGREERGHLAPYSQPDPLLQPWHVLLKDEGGFELDPF